MNKTAFFSIGEFSRLTGVSIKALHYYEKIHILKPAYIDTDNNYRYYSIYQIHQVAIIELLVDLNIRLNQLPEFAGEDFAQVDLPKILAYGKEQTLEKMEHLENKMRYIDYLDQQLHTLSKPNAETPSSALYSGAFWLLPCDCASSMTDAIRQITRSIRPYGLQFHDSYGRILFCNGMERRFYYYINIKIPAGRQIIHEHIFYPPSGNYRTLHLAEPSLEHASKLFPDLFALPYDKIIIETDFSSKPDHSHYALSCLLPLEG